MRPDRWLLPGDVQSARHREAPVLLASEPRPAARASALHLAVPLRMVPASPQAAGVGDLRDSGSGGASGWRSSCDSMPRRTVRRSAPHVLRSALRCLWSAREPVVGYRPFPPRERPEDRSAGRTHAAFTHWRRCGARPLGPGVVKRSRADRIATGGVAELRRQSVVTTCRALEDDQHPHVPLEFTRRPSHTGFDARQRPRRRCSPVRSISGPQPIVART